MQFVFPLKIHLEILINDFQHFVPWVTLYTLTTIFFNRSLTNLNLLILTEDCDILWTCFEENKNLFDTLSRSKAPRPIAHTVKVVCTRKNAHIRFWTPEFFLNTLCLRILESHFRTHEGDPANWVNFFCSGIGDKHKSEKFFSLVKVEKKMGDF